MLSGISSRKGGGGGALWWLGGVGKQTLTPTKKGWGTEYIYKQKVLGIVLTQGFYVLAMLKEGRGEVKKKGSTLQKGPKTQKGFTLS